MSRTRGVPSAILTLASAAILFACSGGGSSATQSPPAPHAQTTNAATPTVDEATAPPSSIQPSASPALTSCRIGELAFRDTGTNIAAGEERFGTILATNTSDRTCTINGYPGIVPIASNGGVVSANLQRSIYTGAPVQVVLRPGAVSSFGFGHFSEPEPPCVTITGFRVFDPDGSGYQTTNSSFTNCSGGHPVPLEVGPFVAGDKGTVYHRHA